MLAKRIVFNDLLFQALINPGDGRDGFIFFTVGWQMDFRNTFERILYSDVIRFSLLVDDLLLT